MRAPRGFTLLELLITIGALAILSALVVFMLNPTEYLNRARDTQRLNDLNTIKQAVSLASTQAALAGKVLDFDGPNYPNNSCAGQSSQRLFVSVPEDNQENSPEDPPGSGRWNGFIVTRVNSGNLPKVDGNGWIPIDFPEVFTPQPSPLPKLPIDPVNTFGSGYYYSYVCGSYALAARMQSEKFLEQAAVDGGNKKDYLEVGSDIDALPLLPEPEIGDLCSDGIDNDGDGTFDKDNFTDPSQNDPGCFSGPSPTLGVTPDTAPQGALNVPLTIAGINFEPGSTVNFSGSGITVEETQFSGSFLFNVKISIDPTAPLGPRDITVTHPDQTTLSCENCFTVTAP